LTVCRVEGETNRGTVDEKEAAPDPIGLSAFNGSVEA
jgi:hypothetical protein